MSTAGKSDPCPDCHVECDGKASIKMNVKRVFRGSDETPPPTIYQWDADYDFSDLDLGELNCDKGYPQSVGEGDFSIDIGFTLKEALTKHLNDLLGGPTQDRNFKPDVKSGDKFTADMEFYLFAIIEPDKPECDPPKVTVIPNGSPNIS